MNTTVHFSSASPEWYSPPIVLSVARAALGAIDLDPASCDAAQTTVQAARYFTQADDGLSQRWAGRVYLNPPYGDEIAQWVARSVTAYVTGEIAAAVLLLPARVDTAWFQDFAAVGWLCFWRGRLRFSGAESGAPFPSVLMYLGDAPERFRAAAAPYGRICPPMATARPALQLSLAAA